MSLGFVNMMIHRSMFLRMLFSFVVCLLLCAIVSAEIPEFLSLMDNTSNDFTVRKPASVERTRVLGVAKQLAMQVAVNAVARGTIVFQVPANKDASPTGCGLFLLNSVLRR